jgi:hypothetical protein
MGGYRLDRSCQHTYNNNLLLLLRCCLATFLPLTRICHHEAFENELEIVEIVVILFIIVLNNDGNLAGIPVAMSTCGASSSLLVWWCKL